jgi:hypothetical protein
LVAVRNRVRLRDSTFNRSNVMKLSILGLTLALGLSAGLAAAAQADQLASAPTQAQTEQQSFAAYKANTNPAATVATTGPYDQEDLYVGRHGFPLNGWSQIADPQS